MESGSKCFNQCKWITCQKSALDIKRSVWRNPKKKSTSCVDLKWWLSLQEGLLHHFGPLLPVFFLDVMYTLWTELEVRVCVFVCELKCVKVFVSFPLHWTALNNYLSRSTHIVVVSLQWLVGCIQLLSLFPPWGGPVQRS